MREINCTPKSKNKFKPGEEVICIENAGVTSSLTIGKTYKIIDSYVDHGANMINLEGVYITVFSSRFTTLKAQRKEKLEKINNI